MMMKQKKNRKNIIIFLVFIFVLFLTIFFILFSLNKNINLFYTPTQIYLDNVPFEKKIKMGGFVKKGSIVNDNSLNVFFEVTDYKNNILVKYNGLLPDLFGENKGIVVIGYLNNNSLFVAQQVLAKHDENYVSIENFDSIKAIIE